MTKLLFRVSFIVSKVTKQDFLNGKEDVAGPGTKVVPYVSTSRGCSRFGVSELRPQVPQKTEINKEAGSASNK
jgi:hypothetical protein